MESTLVRVARIHKLHLLIIGLMGEATRSIQDPYQCMSHYSTMQFLVNKLEKQIADLT